ncbi:MAG: AAA family ATPase, partial [Candidatus Cloacimonadaceae bacterium]|nr:AAA family ATPase [Candidatus Cloacimonadaceae bacterium]
PADFLLAEKNEVAACHQKYLEADSKENYCDDKSPSCWGCRMLNDIVLRHEKTPYSSNTEYWYQYGSFIDSKTWRINREELTKALEAILKRKSLDFCPVFQYTFFRRYIAALPLMVHLPDPGNWDIVYRTDAPTSSKRWEPINIMHLTPSSESGIDTGSELEGKSPTKVKDENASDSKYIRKVPLTTFADIGGVDEIIQNIRIMIELPLKKPRLFEQLGVKAYRGILLWGDPGNGKTLIAKAIAHEVNAHFIPVSGPDILNKDFGQSEQNLRDIFEEAREYQPSVIFIDEIDSIAQTRFSGESSKWYSTLVNQLLALMDGISDYGNVTVLASTNRPDLLDAALLRPGRFDYKLEIRKPTLPGCKKVLEIATRGMPLADDVDLFAYAEAVAGYSAAEITFLAKEAAMVKLRKALETNEISMEGDDDQDYSFLKIDMSDFRSALHMLKWHRRYVNLTYSLKDKKLT